MKTDGLTRKTRKVAQLVADGLTDKEIAAALDISEDGVGYHVRRIVLAWGLDRNRNIRVLIANKCHDSLRIA